MGPGAEGMGAGSASIGAPGAVTDGICTLEDCSAATGAAAIAMAAEAAKIAKRRMRFPRYKM